jgi:hypothetical protein
MSQQRLPAPPICFDPQSREDDEKQQQNLNKPAQQLKQPQIPCWDPQQPPKEKKEDKNDKCNVN